MCEVTNGRSTKQDAAAPAGSRSLLETIATWIAIAGALFGGVFGLYQFVGNLQASKAKEALAYVEHFSEVPVSSAFNHFVEYYKDFRSKHSQQELSEQAMIEFISGHDIEGEVIVVIHYFDNVAVCTCKRLCDEQLVTLFLRSPAQDFFAVTGPYIANAWKTGDSPSSQGAGLRALASPTTAKIDCSFVPNSFI